MSNLTHSNNDGTNGGGYGNATLLDNPNLCTLSTCDLSMANFDYIPTLPGNAIYAAIFGIAIFAQLFLGIKHKTWGYMVAMIFGLLLEVIGYVGRVLLHNNPFENNYFLIYLVCLTIAPALFTAAIYLCLARIVHVYGENLSFFRPRTYTLVFCTCDLISLVLQALGGGIASTSDTLSGKNLGRNIMLAGLIFQVISLALFALASGEFALRVIKNKSQWNVRYIDLVNSLLFKSFLVGLVISSVTIFARSVYRCAELAGGFNGELFRGDEALFMVLEGLMLVIATIWLTALHPAVAFQGTWHESNFRFRSKDAERKLMQSTDEESQTAIEMNHQAFTSR
ncbi:Sphingoid long-chain base transporter RSB1 [Lachnellula suecica]|uniref:Sphingoid long-chain base transporter RSB1 n=1 Tax=Lachnellula suecica TaxID=602035 RepID=A0A8T9CRJ8_9HELO|nr:Sphingoid long-chain base transporter RSB1 [Lachnellula suecica]